MTARAWVAVAHAVALLALGAAGRPASAGAPGLRVRVLVSAQPGSTPGLLRGELEAMGFSVDERVAPEGDPRPALETARKEGAFAVVLPEPSGERAAAEVVVLGTRTPRSERATIDLGRTRGLGQGERMRLLGTLAVRVGELLRAAAAGEALPERAPASASAAFAADAPAPPRAPEPEATAPARPVPAPATPAPAPVEPAAHTPAPQALLDHAAEAEAAAAPAPPVAARDTGLGLDVGLAAGRSVDSVGNAVGPRLRLSWVRPSGLLLAIDATGLVYGRELHAETGQAMVVQTVALLALGYRGRPLAGRFSPEASLGLGTQHTLARGQGAPGYHGVWDGVFVLAVGGGLGLSARLSTRALLVADATAFRLFPRPTIAFAGAPAARAQALCYLASLSARLRL